VIYFECDVDNGSSGSSIFDSQGRIVANLGWWDGGPSIILLNDRFLSEPPPPVDADVMMVFDRSGSMSLPGESGTSKLSEAKEAASLFVDLIATGQGHRVGLVTFSTASSLDEPLSAVTTAKKNDLIGPPEPGIIDDISAGGLTGIGGALLAAQNQFPAPASGNNTPFVLLMTDGLENVAPLIGTVESQLGSTRLCTIGFGKESALNGPLLTTLSREHGGIYTRAGDGLELKKFFVLCFGNIFESEIALDPHLLMPERRLEAEPVRFLVCGESRLTVVIGWERPVEQLFLSLISPAGNTIEPPLRGVLSSSGDTWAYLQLALPFGRERDGVWQAVVLRTRAAGLRAERFFLTTLVEGGPRLRSLNARRVYTNEKLHPLVHFDHGEDGEEHGVEDVRVFLEIERPLIGTGNVLAESGLGRPAQLEGDAIDARTTSLLALDRDPARPLVPTESLRVELFDDALHEDGAPEEHDGVYGNPQVDLTRFEGHYRFRAIATFRGRDGCEGTRETTWSAFVGVGIDPESTPIRAEELRDLPGGGKLLRVRFRPGDAIGNLLGPGRLDAFEVVAGDGTRPQGAVEDLGDGDYEIDIAWDGTGGGPELAIEIPDRARLSIPIPGFDVEGRFVRGDANSSGSIDLSDGIGILNYLFLGQAAPACLDAADVDDSSAIDLSDSVRIFGWLFLGGRPPEPPTPRSGNFGAADCGIDPTPDRLGCDASSRTCSG
jgi:hypothetical protein